MAAAYYAAEAAQTTAGSNLQLATVQATNQTAQTQIAATAATSINAANDTAAVTMNASQYGAAQTIGLAQTAASVSQSNNATTASIASSNAAASAAAAAAQASQAHDAAMLASTLIPTEQAATGGSGGLSAFGFNIVAAAPVTPNAGLAAGFTSAQLNQAYASQGATPAPVATQQTWSPGTPLTTVNPAATAAFWANVGQAA